MGLAANLVHLDFGSRMDFAVAVGVVGALFGIAVGAAGPVSLNDLDEFVIGGAGAHGVAEGGSVGGEETGDEAAIGGEAETDAIAAEGLSDGSNDADFAGPVAVGVAVGDFAAIVGGDGFEGHFGVDAVDDLAGADDAGEVPVVAVADVHEFDEADDVGGAFELAGEVDEGVVVDAALDDAVHLEGIEAGGGGGVDSLKDGIRGVVAAVHFPEDLVVETVDADGETVEAGVLEIAGVAGEEVAVGGESQIFETFDFDQFTDDVGDVAAEEGFTSGEANLLDAEPDEKPGDALDFLEGEDVLAGEEFVVFAEYFGGHAVGTAEVATVGEGDAEIAQGAAEGISQRWVHAARLIGRIARWNRVTGRGPESTPGRRGLGAHVLHGRTPGLDVEGGAAAAGDDGVWIFEGEAATDEAVVEAKLGAVDEDAGVVVVDDLVAVAGDGFVVGRGLVIEEDVVVVAGATAAGDLDADDLTLVIGLAEHLHYLVFGEIGNRYHADAPVVQFTGRAGASRRATEDKSISGDGRGEKR